MEKDSEKEFKPCGEGDNICKCKDSSECGYSSEVAFNWFYSDTEEPGQVVKKNKSKIKWKISQTLK